MSENVAFLFSTFQRLISTLTAKGSLFPGKEGLVSSRKSKKGRNFHVVFLKQPYFALVAIVYESDDLIQVRVCGLCTCVGPRAHIA